MQPTEDLGLSHFLANADVLTRGILIILLTMSVVSWYLILSRALMHLFDYLRAQALLRALPQLDSPAKLEAYVAQHPSTDSMTTLVAAGIDAGRSYTQGRKLRPGDDKTADELLVRDLDEAVNDAGTRLERGLIVLASTGISAPYIGLLGTVWGVYHALVSIGLSGQGTLDKVAGPVGEALIMTALGLAVAIPAVLGYNAFIRANRVAAARLSAVANRLLRTFTLGHSSDHGSGSAAASNAQPATGAA
jgi:biopolymer transport protein ExbB